LHSTTSYNCLDWLISAANLEQMTDISLDSKVKRRKRKALKALHKFDSKVNVYFLRCILFYFMLYKRYIG